MGNTVGDQCCKLRSASQSGDVEVCKELIARGARVSCQDNMWHSTALHESCRFGHNQVAKLLLESGSVVDARDCVGQTPLFYACKGGFDYTIQLLLEHGADVNAVSTKGKTPLHSALQAGNRCAAYILLEAGAKPSVRDSDGATPCQLAARKGCLRCLVCIHSVFQAVPPPNLGELVDLTDSSLCPKVRLVLSQWISARQRAADMRVPTEKEFSEGTVESLGLLFGCSPPGESRAVREYTKNEHAACSVLAALASGSMSLCAKRKARPQDEEKDESDDAKATADPNSEDELTENECEQPEMAVRRGRKPSVVEGDAHRKRSCKR